MARNTKAARVVTTTYATTGIEGIDLATTEKGSTYARITVGRWSSNISAAHLDLILANVDMIRALVGSAPAPAAPAPAPAPAAPAPVKAAAPAPAPAPKAAAPAPTGDKVTPAMLADAKELHVKAAHLYKSASKLQAAIDAKLAKMGGTTAKNPPRTPAPAPAPTVAAAAPAPAPAGITLSKSSPAPLRVERHPAAPALVTIALGENGQMYTIMIDPITGKLTAALLDEVAAA